VTAPFREPGQSCPRCAGQALREHDGHLACDACDSLLIAPGELAASIHELDGGETAVETRDPEPLAAPCPRCAGAMQGVTLVVGGQALGGGFYACPRDGVWMPRDVLAAIYAAAGRRAREAHAAKGRPYGAVIRFTGEGHGRAGPPPGGGMVAAIQSVGNAFAHGGELAISNWQARTPRVHTLFVSAFRGRWLRCAGCGHDLAFEGDRWACPGCAGSFVEDAALVAMVSEMSGAPFELPPPSGKPGARACPVCGDAMTVEQLERAAVERCARHGHWFDPDELQRVLQHAADHPTSWLHRLFHH